MKTNRRTFVQAAVAGGAGVFLAGGALKVHASDDSALTVQRGRTKIYIDPRTGSVGRIVDTATGQTLLDAFAEGRSDGRLFRIITPRPMWWGRPADSHQQPPPEIQRCGDALLIRYRNLLAGGEETGINAEVRVEPSNAADELLFSLRLENRGNNQVADVFFPWLGGLDFSKQRGQVLAIGAKLFWDPAQLPLPGGPPCDRYRQRGGAMRYSVELAAPWINIPLGKAGLSYINYMPEAQMGYLALENLAGYDYHGPRRLALAWVHTLKLSPGETWTSPPLGLSVHEGDWHETADRYRHWVTPRLRAAPGVMHNRAMIGFQNVVFRDFDGTRIHKLEDLPRVAAIARKYGVSHISVWDYLSQGNYSKLDPVDVLEYSPAEAETLQRVLRQAKTEGSDMNAVVNFRFPNTHIAQRGGEILKQIKRCYDGSPQTENWSANGNLGTWLSPHIGPQSYIYSSFSPEYRQWLFERVKRYIDLGYTSMFYDQPFEVMPDYGFCSRGGRPEMTYVAKLKLIAEVRNLLRQNDPRSIMIGEECEVFASQYIDMWMSWGLSSPAAIPGAVLTRYSLPHTMMSWTVDNEPERASIAFALGMYLCLCVHGTVGTLDDEPVLAQHIRRLADLRQRSAARTVAARFNDTRGLSVKKDSEDLLAFGYDSPEGPAVIVAAPKTGGSIEVAIDRTAFTSTGDSKHGRVMRLDGGTAETSGSKQQFKLAANEVAVWVT